MSFLLEDAYKPLHKEARAKNKHWKSLTLKFLEVFKVLVKYGIVFS